MADIAKAIKAEITRLSKKEVKKAALPLNTQVRTLLKTVAAQEKKISRLEKIVARQEMEVKKAAPVPEAASLEEVKKSRISPRLVKVQRKRLQLSQGEFARLLDVSVAAVRSWEQGRALPREETMAVFVAVRKLKPQEAWDRLQIAPPKAKAGKQKRVPRQKPAA